MNKGKELSIYFAFPVGILYQNNPVDEVNVYITDKCQAINIEELEELKTYIIFPILLKLFDSRKD